VGVKDNKYVPMDFGKLKDKRENNGPNENKN
jgi:hypothetical protein